MGLAGLQWPPSLRPQRSLQRADPGLAEPRRALVGGILQHPPDDTAIPAEFPITPRLARPLQAPTHFTDTHSFLADPRENLAHDPRLLLHDLKARGAPTQLLADIMIAIRRTTQDTHHPRVGSVALAPTTAF